MVPKAGSWLAFKASKTKAGRRTISIPPSVVAELKNHWRRQQEGRLALGMGKAGPVALMREIIKRVADDCLPFTTRRMPGVTWMTHALTFDQAIRAITAALDTLRPPGDPTSVARGDILWSGNLQPGLSQRVGQIAAALVLDAVVDPANATAGLAPRAKPLAEKLGPGLVDRVRAKEPRKMLIAALKGDDQ